MSAVGQTRLDMGLQLKMSDLSSLAPSRGGGGGGGGLARSLPSSQRDESQRYIQQMYSSQPYPGPHGPPGQQHQSQHPITDSVFHVPQQQQQQQQQQYSCEASPSTDAMQDAGEMLRQQADAALVQEGQMIELRATLSSQQNIHDADLQGAIAKARIWEDRAAELENQLGAAQQQLATSTVETSDAPAAGPGDVTYDADADVAAIDELISKREAAILGSVASTGFPFLGGDADALSDIIEAEAPDLSAMNHGGAHPAEGPVSEEHVAMHLALEGKRREILEQSNALVVMLGQLDQRTVEVDQRTVEVEAREAAARKPASKEGFEIKALCTDLNGKAKQIAALEADRQAFVRCLAEKDEEIDRLRRQLGNTGFGSYSPYGGSPPRRRLSSSAFEAPGPLA